MPVSADEQRCDVGACGADVIRRGVYRHCSGVSPDCPTDTLREGDWEVFQDCSDDQVCVYIDGAPLCYTCTDGCSDGYCVEHQCDSGACCAEGHFAASTTRCSEAPVERECRCASSACGSDVECRDQYPYCTGLSAECTNEALEWDDWAVTETCASHELCDMSSAECYGCTYGCEAGACITCSLTSDGECPGGCDISNDADCCEDETCQLTPDGCCPSSCGVSNDGDCDYRWVERTPTSARPSFWDHAMAYDSSRGVTVAAGQSTVDESFVTWEWDGAEWVERTPSTRPPARRFPSLAYDSTRGVTVLFGGQAASFFADTWEWDGTDWSERTPATSPLARRDTAMVYDSARGVVVSYGGTIEDGYLTGELWEYGVW